jgi:hypothetical protein
MFDSMAKSNSHKHAGAADAASSIASFTAELAVIARRNGLDTLGYLLEMARLEAETQSRPPAVSG